MDLVFVARSARAVLGHGRRADTRMPLKESEAIVLRSYPLGEADRLISFLSRTMGRLRGVARGARRPKSRFGSTLEPLSYIRIWFYERETRELVRINQCELIWSFLDVQRDYTAALGLSLISEVSEAVLPEREPADAAFRLILVAANAIADSGRIPLPLAYFNLWTVRLGGWLPSLERCAHCGTQLGAGSGFASALYPGMRCEACRGPAARSISAGALALAKRMLAEKLEVLSKQDWPAAPLQELNEYLLDTIEHQIERKLATRRLLEEPQELGS